MGPTGVKTEPFSWGCVLAAGLWSGWVCCSSSIPALSGAGGFERGQAPACSPRLGVPQGRECRSRAGFGLQAGLSKSRLWDVPWRSCFCTGAISQELLKHHLQGTEQGGLPVHPKRLVNAEKVRDFPKRVAGPSAAIGGRVKDKMSRLKSLRSELVARTAVEGAVLWGTLSELLWAVLSETPAWAGGMPGSAQLCCPAACLLSPEHCSMKKKTSQLVCTSKGI